jgi:hypothetical protein
MTMRDYPTRKRRNSAFIAVIQYNVVLCFSFQILFHIKTKRNLENKLDNLFVRLE